jgi:hypothetical protein
MAAAWVEVGPALRALVVGLHVFMDRKLGLAPATKNRSFIPF